MEVGVLFKHGHTKLGNILSGELVDTNLIIQVIREGLNKRNMRATADTKLDILRLCCPRLKISRKTPVIDLITLKLVQSINEKTEVAFRRACFLDQAIKCVPDF